MPILRTMILLSIMLIGGDELFSEKTIIGYLKKDNPFIYNALGQHYIDRAKEETALSVLDTKLSTKFDNKKYPASEGDFFDLSIAKPLENGLDIVTGFRKAEGVQEYNNIKTSNQGEIRFGVQVPVFELIEDINARKYHLRSASLQSTQSGFQSKDNLRLLYAQIRSLYNKILYYKSIVELEKKLYKKAKERQALIEKKVEAGDVAQVALLEIEQQLINRKQRIISAENFYMKIVENFLKYLNISRDKFEAQYYFMDLLNVEKKYINRDKAIEEALRNRPDLEVLAYEESKLGLEKKRTKLLKYPKLNVGFYAVHDLKYENGIKVMLDMEFPIEQRKYYGKEKEIQLGLENLKSRKKMKIETIKTNLTTIVNSLDLILENISNSENEIALVEKLEEVENKKYVLGASNLFMLNQREIYSLEIKKKYLQYTLQYLLLVQDAENEMGRYFTDIE